MDWVSDIAGRVEAREPPYVVKGGISPSGPMHVGHLNEIIIPHLVAQELRDRGYEVQQYLTIDDLDPGVTSADERVREIEYVVNALQLDVDLWRASDAYSHDTVHLDTVKTAIRREDEIESIVEDYQDVDEFELYDGTKLTWRAEWAAQWATLGVDFEPYGKDHAEGSFESSARIARIVFDIYPPCDLVYEWFTVNGEAMSSSSGTVVEATDVIEWICRDDLLSLFERRPDRQREFDERNIPSMIGSVADGPSYEEMSRYWLGDVVSSHVLFSHQDIDDEYAPRMVAAGRWAEEFGDDYTIVSDEPDSGIEPVDALIEYAQDGHTADEIQSYAYDCANEYGDVSEFFTRLYEHVVGQPDGPPAGELLHAMHRKTQVTIDGM